MTTPHPGLAARGLRPAAELAANRPCGDRLRYMAGCRCAECRRANTQYEKGRALARKAGDWNGFVPAERARAHMAELSKLGVGRRVVCDVANVSDSVLAALIRGRKRQIRARTERSILAVTAQAAADRAYIDAAPTWRLIDELLADGYTKAELARQLGYERHTLQLRRHQVTNRNAFEVRKLHARLRSCDATEACTLLQDLSEEGFHRDRVERQLAQLASEMAVDVPDLTIRQGRMRASTAQLVQMLHKRLTE